MPVIFLAGIHGVGKSTLCEAISRKVNIPCHSASNLIRKANSTLLRTTDKVVKDVGNNQDVLVYAVQKELKIFQTIILDGHFTLISDSNTITAVKREIFELLEVKLIGVVLETPSVICSRLLARDGRSPSEHFLRAHQTHEIQHAKRVATSLNVKLTFMRSTAPGNCKLFSDYIIAHQIGGLS